MAAKVSPDQKNRRVTRNLAAKNPGRGVSSGGVTKTSPKAARTLRMTPAKAEFAKVQAKTPRERPRKTPQSLESAVKAMKVSDNEEEIAAAPKSARRSLFQEKKTEETPGKLDLKVRLKKRTSKQWGIAGPNSPFGAIKEPSTTGRKSMHLKIDGDEDYNLSDESEEEEKLEIEESEDEDFVRSKSRTRKTPQKMQRRASRSRKPANDDGVSPTKKARLESVKPKPNTLEWVRSQLCAALIPDRLPCRDQEYRHIEVFFKKAIAKNSESQSMYISGVPGTGKTATVLQVARMYKEQKSSPKFHFIHVNAMELSDPKMFFAAVFKQYAGKDASAKIAATTARRTLNDMLLYEDKTRHPIVLLVDELDLLCTKRQDVIYDIFNWSAVPESRVNVIAIANTLDLPERALSQRITSRVGFNRLVFQPYEFSQISSILLDRLKGTKCISKDAVLLASRKVASISGDLRKALDIVKRAAELAMNEGGKVLELKHIQGVLEEEKSCYRTGLICTISRHETLILQAVLGEISTTGIEEMGFDIVLRNYRALSRNSEGLDPLSANAAYSCALRLCNSGLLKMGRCGNLGWLYRPLQLGMSPQDLRYCLNLMKEKKNKPKI
ncbi:hypothetical protein L596_024538 [Steinernema carpocapsae]|uniref:Origin recognition complex subunit 1 n=1 Tax=Steinernema carpocapsae TaxID=34508 RepID=A0A4U5MH24_STECR|nr:hypothetical protein L596_024538 [Steinernema carpocapsae]